MVTHISTTRAEVIIRVKKNQMSHCFCIHCLQKRSNDHENQKLWSADIFAFPFRYPMIRDTNSVTDNSLTKKKKKEKRGHNVIIWLASREDKMM